MRIEIDYPVEMSFTIREDLPAFKYGCEIRTKLLQKALKGIMYDAPHQDSDFIVEAVEQKGKGEVWIVGS